jgi:Ribbon-helix-helix protein, copG family
MKILQEGDRGVALSPREGRVAVLYEYRDIELDSGVHVANVLVGVHEKTGDILTIPAQSIPRIKQARERTKDETLSARLPHELDDVLWLVADHFSVSSTKFSPALIRFYLEEATHRPRLARRLVKLSRGRLAGAKRASRITVRCDPDLAKRVGELVAALDDGNQSDLVRGAILAAKEDVLEGRARRRSERLQAVAAAV